jgi:hypothetical protein
VGVAVGVALGNDVAGSPGLGDGPPPPEQATITIASATELATLR